MLARLGRGPIWQSVNSRLVWRSTLVSHAQSGLGFSQTRACGACHSEELGGRDRPDEGRPGLTCTRILPRHMVKREDRAEVGFGIACTFRVTQVLWIRLEVAPLS